MTKQNKTRLDALLVSRGLTTSRERARALIMEGKILVDDMPSDKPGRLVGDDVRITMKGENIPYVSRGGLKLKKAVDEFQIDASDMVCMDVGASTGGFTDCLLQHGAKKVYSVDVGYGQLAWQLRNDPRVVVIERTNIRHLEKKKVPDPINLITIDVSFISLKIVVPEALRFLSSSGAIVALIKPQFEVGKGMVGKGGVVKDPGQHKCVISDLCCFFKEQGFNVKGVSDSPILGPKGNKEFLAYITKAGC